MVRRAGQIRSVDSVDGAEGSAVICVYLFQAWKRRAVGMQQKNDVKGLPGCEVLVISGLDVLHVRRTLYPEKFAEPYTGSNDFMK